MNLLLRVALKYSSTAEIPKGFWWLKDGKLAALGKPKRRSDLEYLKNNGVTHLVSLTETDVALNCGEGQDRASVLLACYAVKADGLKARKQSKE